MSKYRDYLKKINGDLLIVAVKPPYIPLKGISGIIDWRLNGFISSLVLTHKLGETYDSPVLIPSNGKLPVQRAALVMYNSDFVTKTSEILKGIRSKNVSIVLPVGEENSEYRNFIEQLKSARIKWAAMRTFLMSNEMIITFNEITHG